jgi:hypothetical protein
MTQFINRRWLIIPASEAANIDFDEVLETSLETLRYSLDGSKTFIKYNIVETIESTRATTNNETGEEMIVTIPAAVYGKPSIYNPEYTEYTHEEILEILRTEEWTPLNIS